MNKILQNLHENIYTKYNIFEYNLKIVREYANKIKMKHSKLK